MDSSRTVGRKASLEINLKDFLKKIFQYKWLFALSILTCLSLAYVYNKLATPIYEVGTSLLIDSSGANRSLGKSQYLDGGLSQIEIKKNIFNEMGVLTSYSLVKQTLEELDYHISYKGGYWYQMKEYYKDFPFEVVLLDSVVQLYGVPFEIKLLPDEKYQLSIKADKFYVSTPPSGKLRKINTPIEFSKIYSIGEEVRHEYFNFALTLPVREVDNSQFMEQDLHFELHHISDLTNTYLNKLSVVQADIQASILQLKTAGPIVEKEVTFLEKLISNYIFTNLKKRDEIASNKEIFIRDQLGDISVSLSRAESKMENFKGRTNSTVNIEQTLSSNMTRLQSLETDLDQIDLNIKYYKQLLAYINDSEGINKIIAPSAVGIDDRLLNENILDLKNLYAEKTKKKFYKGAKSYDLEILDQQIANTRNALQENVRNLIRSSELANREKKGRISKIERKLKTLPRSQKQLGSHERQSNLYEDLYNYLSQELAKTGIARAENITDSRVLDEARVLGSGPVSPQSKLIYLLGLLLGLTLPIAWIIFASSIDHSIQSAEHLEKIAPLPVAASIVHFNDKSLFGLKKGSEWQVEESFRDLSANLQFLIDDPNKNVIGVTSTVTGEGKTFCASNLAISLATSGKQVLLLDTDLRNPAVFKQITQQKKGLSAYLKGEVEFAEQIIHSYPAIKNLKYIPTQSYSKNPHELLSNPRLETLIGELKHHYDYIIIDSPAVGLVSDYLLIAKNIDVHLFILRNQVSKTAYIDDLMKLKEKGSMDDALFIFNDVPTSSHKHGVSYYKKQRSNVKNFVARLFSF